MPTMSSVGRVSLPAMVDEVRSVSDLACSSHGRLRYHAPEPEGHRTEG